MTHIISITIENEAGALSRVVELFSQRNYNIDSLSVAPSTSDDISHLTIATSGSSAVIEQIIKQLNNIIPVLTAFDVTADKHIARELMLVKITLDKPDDIGAITELVSSFKGEILRSIENILVIQLTGDAKYFKSFLQAAASKGSIETVNSGIIGLGY
jgi:acetolactate synthase I/III small subunit